MNGDNMNSARHEASTTFIGGGYLKAQIHGLQTNSKNQTIERPAQWKEFVHVAVHEKGNKVDCNHRGRSVLLTMYKIVFSILVSMLTRSVGEIIGYYECWF
jgi:hypothetical protein